FVAVFGVLLPFVVRSGRPIRTALATAALWTAIEAVRGSWPLGGFTWGGLGYTQHGNHFLLPLASVTGVWGVTFVVVLVNALVLAGLGSVRARPRQAVLAAGLGLAAVLLPVLVPLPTARAAPAHRAGA